MPIQRAEKKVALYFGYREGRGHFLCAPGRYGLLDVARDYPTFPWDAGLLDGGLLKNRRVPDAPDGRVHWVAGGTPLWLGFFWWDRSGDRRGASNSGFYVHGFLHTELQAALDYACTEWPAVVKRQHHSLVLVERIL